MRFNDLIKPVQVPHEVFKFKKENQARFHDFTNTLFGFCNHNIYFFEEEVKNKVTPTELFCSETGVNIEYNCILLPL